MAVRRQAAALTALVALAANGPASAQDAHLVVTLAGDPERSGPPAWTWARERVLPRLVESGAETPLGAIELRIESRGHVACRAVEPPGPGSYARLELHFGGTGLARGTLEFDGSERWHVALSSRRAELPAAVHQLVTRFAYEARTGWLSIDLAAATGNLMAAAAAGDPIGEALTLGAVECGTVSVVANEAADGALEIRGRSGGGIALPALLLALADAQTQRVPTTVALPDDVERWLLLAASAKAEEQEEAARQLSRFDDPRAHVALERLLHADGRVRLIAMHGLTRLGVVDSLGAIAAAADPAVPGSATVAARAIVRLATPDLRDALVAQLAEHPPEPAPSPLAETAPGDSDVPSRPGTWLAALIAGITIGALGAAAALRRHA